MGLDGTATRPFPLRPQARRRASGAVTAAGRAWAGTLRQYGLRPLERGGRLAGLLIEVRRHERQTTVETRIIYNGVEYASVEDMPPDVRFAYEQALIRFADDNRDGIPDVAQGGGRAEIRVESRSRYIVNDREYSSLDGMPPDVRSAIERLRDRAIPSHSQPRIIRSGNRPKRVSCSWTILMGVALAVIAVLTLTT